jgi:DDE family transposase
MGAKHREPGQWSFNGCLRVDCQGSRITSDDGLILVRELDERLGCSELIAAHLTEPHRGKNTPRPVADRLRQSVSSRLAGDEDVNGAERVSPDPTFRLIGSEKNWARGAALTCRLLSCETARLTHDERFTGLAQINGTARQRPPRRGLGRTAAPGNRASTAARRGSGLSGRCGRRQSGDLRGLGGAWRDVCDPSSRKRQPGAGHCRVADQARGAAQSSARGVVQERPRPGVQAETRPAEWSPRRSIIRESCSQEAAASSRA